MDTGSDKPRTLGVLAHLKPEGEGYRLILDDLEGMEKDGEWRKRTLFTWKDIPKEKFDELSFDNKELADFGFHILARLKALVHPSQPEAVNEADVRWRKEILLDVIKEGSKKRITLKLSEPMGSSLSEDCFCLVSLNGILKSDKRVYGVDEAQARTLSIQFICSTLQHYEIRSPDGQPVSIEKVLS